MSGYVRYNPRIAVGKPVGKSMGRQINKLSARKVETVRTPGRHSDGGGLYLNITEGGGRSWLFMYKVGGGGAKWALVRCVMFRLSKLASLRRMPASNSPPD